MNPALLPSLPPCLLLIPLLSARPSSPFYTSGDMFPADDGEEGKGGKKIGSLRSSLFLLHVFLFVCFFWLFCCCFLLMFGIFHFLSSPSSSKLILFLPVSCQGENVPFIIPIHTSLWIFFCLLFVPNSFFWKLIPFHFLPFFSF